MTVLGPVAVNVKQMLSVPFWECSCTVLGDFHHPVKTAEFTFSAVPSYINTALVASL